MILKKRIPKDFYKLFRTKNREIYMELLVAIYHENSEVYAALGLTREECVAIANETLARTQIDWEDEQEDESEEGQRAELSASLLLGRLIDWGWLKSDFDQKMNSYIISFPEYSQLFTELFQKLQKEDDSRERESILSVYSALFTFHSDPERNNDILKNALRTSKGLGQLLSNMQDGMRAYFDKLSVRKNFIGIQEVLVEEINNSDSKRYAILTTTDSFYRYKEAVKELIGRILNENDLRKLELEQRQSGLEKDSVPWMRGRRAMDACEEANALIYQIEREFDQIERKYNKLIEQKTIFARRALARVRYILQEGADEADNLIRLVSLLDRSEHCDEIVGELCGRMKFSVQFGQICEGSFYSRRERVDQEFQPVQKAEAGAQEGITDFVPRPLYTKRQLRDFRRKNTYDGKFMATESAVQSVEDLEMLLFLWQEETEVAGGDDRISLDGEIATAKGFKFSGLTIEEGEHA